MKDYKDFLNSLDDEKLHQIKREIENRPIFINAPTNIDKSFLQATLISSLMIGMYHEWVSKE